ncbi:FHA domain-containing protein [Actinomyces sp. oral taxon 171]|uniref:FHA domain-containing protein n=1 Tax=Actinomyces sp. oral taxon 171 TaxID=706438 RepID=UPI0005552C03|nr:FHA domain-containing protein [Actinomyces sp. oral taxon 171]QCT34046.1 FHA domain-containing protein [Actinomyces sp. oral taxon 171 str. F0337]
MMTNSPNSSANNEVWWTEGSWTGVVTPRAVMILPPSVPQDLTERLWRLLRSEEASLTRALDELVMGMGGRLGAIPDFVLAVSAPEDVFHVALRGAPQMEVDGKALDASAVTTWFETTVTAPNSLIVSAPDGAGQVRRPAVDAVVSTGHLVLRGSEKSSGTPSPSRASSKGSGDSDDDDPDPAGPDYSTTSAGSAGSPAAAVRTSRSSRRASRRASRRQSASSDRSEQDDSSEGAPAETAASPDVVDDLIEIAQDNAEQQARDGAELAASLETAEAAEAAESTTGRSADSAVDSDASEEPALITASEGPADLLAVVAGISEAAEATSSPEPVEAPAELSTPVVEVVEADAPSAEAESFESFESFESVESVEAPAVALDAQAPEAAEVATQSSPEASDEDPLIAPVFDIPALPIPSAQEAEAMIPPPPPPSSEDLEATGIKDAAAEVTEVAQTPADFVPVEAAVVAEATAVAEAAAQAHAEEEPVRSGDHDGQTINGLPEDLSQELRAELLNQGLGPLEPGQSAEAAESAGSAAAAATVVELVHPSADEPSSADLGRGDHDGQTINGLPEDLVGELVSLVGAGPSSPTSPVSASSPSEPDAIRIVLSAVCPQGHPNPTNYTVCRVCGAELNRPAKSVACPPLGRVVISGGESIELNRPLLVGRNPVADDITSVAEVPLRPLIVASPNQLVSRNHILIDLDAWSVLAQDLGNCNGTVLNRQNEAPVRLSSANPVLLRSGDVLDLGDGQTLAFENLP